MINGEAERPAADALVIAADAEDEQRERRTEYSVCKGGLDVLTEDRFVVCVFISCVSLEACTSAFFNKGWKITTECSISTPLEI